jgi:hypothetical protein
MAILHFTVDTDDLIPKYEDSDAPVFEDLFRQGLRDSLVQDMKGRFANDEFKKFTEEVTATVEEQVKSRMQNFLDEEIVLTGEWGKKVFVGSVDDYIKSRFDAVLLHPVNSRGERLSGCTTESKTWIQWQIGEQVKERIERLVQQATDTIHNSVGGAVKAQVAEILDSAVKEKVGAAFQAIMERH